LIEKPPSEAFGIHQSDGCLWLIRDVAVKLPQKGVRRQFLADTRASKMKGKYGTKTKGCIVLMKFLTVTDTNNLIVNIELTVRLNLKWPNSTLPLFIHSVDT